MQTSLSVRNSVSYWRLFAMPVLVGVTLFSTLIFIGFTGLNIARHHAPLADAAMEIKYELALFHLRFEEHLEFIDEQERGGAKYVSIQLAWKHLNQSLWYANALLHGGKNQEGEFVPLENPKLRQQIEKVLGAWDVLRNSARQRLEEMTAGNLNRVTEERFDAAFNQLLGQADDTETALQIAMAGENSTFQRLLFVLSALSLLLMITMGIARYRFESSRRSYDIQLSEKTAELERFVYTVSHDLKSPLITIQGFLGLLEKDANQGDKERLQGDVGQIRKAANKMELLLSDVLEISRIGRISNAPEQVELYELTQEVVEGMMLQLKQYGAEVEIQPGLPVLYADRKRMVEVMQNLIENALKFMGEQSSPRIEIGVREEAGGNIVFVSDNGIGIEPRYHDKVFDLFERLNPDIDGTGIGLAIVKRIIELNHGRIWLESEGNGKGSAFCFILPTQL